MKRIIKYIDKPLLLVSVVLFIIGLIMVFSASSVTAYMSHEVSPYNYFMRQGFFLLAGIIIFFFMIRFTTKSYGMFSKLLLLGGIVALVLVLFLVEEKNQAVSWFRIGFFGFQPSEFIKVITIVFLADYYDKNQKKLTGWGASLYPIGLCVVIAGLIAFQPDLGTTIIYAAIVAAIFIAVPISGEIKYKTIFAAVGILGFGAIVLFSTGRSVLLESQMERFDYHNPCD